MKGAEAAERSALYARYNGGMLGYFFAGSLARHVRPRYPVLRSRINEFLEELGTLPLMPANQLSLEASEQLFKELMFVVRQESPVIADAALMTSLAFYHVLLREADPGTSADSRDAALKLMDRFEMEATALDRFAGAITPNEQGQSASELHTAGLTFLREMLEPLATSEETVFVAMPFAPPHDTYFARFYQPTLAKCDRPAIRAWGGLASEDYQRLVHTLIAKSAGVLADLTTQNINVIHEVGLADGLGRPTFLITAADDAMPPSNIADRAIMSYDRSDDGWEERESMSCAMLILASLVAIQEGLSEGVEQR